MEPLSRSTSTAYWRSALRLALLAGLLPLLLSGCERSMSDLESWVAEVKRKQGPALEPPPTQKSYDTFVYRAFDLRDPFEIPLGTDEEQEQEIAAGTGLRPDPNRTREPLESFPIDALRMVGTLVSGGNFWGLLRDPMGVVHRVLPNEYVGQNHGRIVAVSENRIEVQELIQKPNGAWEHREASIALDAN